MKKNQLFLATFFALSLATGAGAQAEETQMEKVETAANKGTDHVKKAYRKAQDKACEMVDGKMQCAAQKVGNKIKNGTDTLKTDAQEAKKKID